uniref:Uncharacterized protein n=1 Tax=Anguilla anguilla TaxID=7936 RepID=A0A0E9R213_ANGAN
MNIIILFKFYLADSKLFRRHKNLKNITYSLK